MVAAASAVLDMARTIALSVAPVFLPAGILLERERRKRFPL
jgi:hypothetical protein